MATFAVRDPVGYWVRDLSNVRVGVLEAPSLGFLGSGHVPAKCPGRLQFQQSPRGLASVVWPASRAISFPCLDAATAGEADLLGVLVPWGMRSGDWPEYREAKRSP